MSESVRGWRLAASVGACLMVASAGCAGDDELHGSSPDPGSSENVGTAEQPLTFTQDGFKVTWTHVGHPTEARKIAACGDHKVFAIKMDGRLFANTTDGSDNGWQLVNWPIDADEIACDGSYLFALNYDRNLYRASSSGAVVWSWMGRPASPSIWAQFLRSGNGNIYATGDPDPYDASARAVWTSYGGLVWSNGVGFVQSPDEGKDATWVKRAVLGLAVHGVTGAGGGGLQPGGTRAFGSDGYHSLLYNDRLLSSSSITNWHSLNSGGLTFETISAGTSTALYGLTFTTKDLWKATFTEDNCYDGIDNDQSGGADAGDGTCRARVGGDYCAAHQNGNYCYSRFWPSASGLLATCASGQLVAVQGSLGCPCTLAGTGADYLPSCIQ